MNKLSAHLRASGTPRLYRKKEHLLFQGEIPRHVTLILDGIVKAYAITSGGEERIAALYGKGDLIPIAWSLGQAPNSLFHYEALNDVRTLQVTRTEFDNLLETNPEFHESLLAMLGMEYAALLLRVTGLVQSRAIEKISYTLYYLMFRHGIDRGNDEYSIDVKLSQSALADLIGQTRESTAKNLKVLKEKGVVSYNSSIYTVNKSKLEAFLGEDAFLDAGMITRQ